MKKTTLALICTVMYIKAFSQYPAPCFKPTPQWKDVLEIKEKVEKSKPISESKKDELLNRFQKLKENYEDTYYGRSDFCKSLAEYTDQVQLYTKELEEYNAEKMSLETEINKYTAQCSGQLPQDQYSSCLAWKSKLDELINKNKNWYDQLTSKKQNLDEKLSELNKRSKQDNIEEINNDESFIKDAKEALKAEFSDTKTYHLTAKSWINSKSLSDFSINGKIIQFDSNVEPQSPSLNSNVKDYKIYQSFDVEVKFISGKVVSAKFQSFDIRGGSSFGKKGLVYVKESIISDWKDKESVTFTRTIAGHSKLLWSKEIFTGESPDIYNSMSIEVFPDKIIKHGYASDFPTTYFWIGDEIFAKKLQVQPSEYFK